MVVGAGAVVAAVWVKQGAASPAMEPLTPGGGVKIEFTDKPLPVPAFALTDLSGKRVAEDTGRGKVVLINFWATWCGPCKVETPWLVELRNQYAAKGFEVLGISAEGDDLQPGDKEGWAKDKAAIAKFVKEEKMPYPVLIDGDSISKPYGGIDAMPTSFYVDRSGNVVSVQLGLTSKDEMESNIRKSLGEGQ
jgi:cytochrome c biogenesis protein CcmG/thiol:disulfide interchange protein DsbE